MSRKFRFFIVTISFLLLMTANILGQERTGTIEGLIKDSQGALIPGAVVKVTGTGVNRTVTTNEDGFYRIPSLPPGVYSVESSATNFAMGKRNNDVVVTLGNITNVTMSLQPGQVDATITVTTQDLPQIDVTDSKAATNLSAEVIERIPKTPNFASVLKYSPSTRPEPNGGGFQVDGASGSENTFVIDGQEVTNFRTGVLNFNNNIPTQFVQEVQVKTGGFEAEFGGATGGVVNVVTKGGGNSFNGNIGFQFFVPKLQTSPNLIQSGSNTTLTYIQPPPTEGTAFLPSFTIGGPIVKNRIWFFTSHAPQYLPGDITWRFADGTQNRYLNSVRQDYSFFRVDSQITNNLRVYGTYTYNPLRSLGIIPTFGSLFATATATAAPLPGSQSEQGGRQPAQAFTFAGNWSPTNNLVIDVRGGRTYLNQKLVNYGIPNETRFRCITAGPQCAAGFSNIPTNTLINKDISIRKTFGASASYFVNNSVLGRHNIKGGYESNYLSNDVDSGNFSNGETRLFFGQTFPDLNGNPRGAGVGEIGYGYLQRNGVFGFAKSNSQAIFVQDSWSPVKNLTLNLGARFEKENVPAFNADQGGTEINFNWMDKFAPRLGFSWDVRGNGKLKVHGFFGRFYDRFKYELPRGSFGGDTFLRDYFVILGANPSPFFYTRTYALANAYRQNNFRVNSNAPGVNLVDPDLKAVRQTEYAVGFEYGLSKDFVLAGRYFRKNLDRTIEDVGVPDALGNETYYIANPGFGIVQQSLISGVPPTPKAIRQYDAMEIRLDKRFSNDFFFNANYTYSRLYGNYGGLASSDEAGRNSPNVNRVFDLPFEPFTPAGVENLGLLPTDRPHVFKFSGGYNLNWRNLFNGKMDKFGANSTNFSIFTTLQSGTPVTSRVDLLDVATVVLNERGDLGRTSKFTQTDFAVSHQYQFGRDNRFRLAFDLNILNLFNERNEMGRYELITLGVFAEGLSGFPATRADTIRAIFNNPNGLRTQIQNLIGTPGFTTDARFNQPNLFQFGRSVQFGFRFMF